MTVTEKPKKNTEGESDARKLGRALFSEEFLDDLVTRSCLAPGLMETSKPGGVREDGSTA